MIIGKNYNVYDNEGHWDDEETDDVEEDGLIDDDGLEEYPSNVKDKNVN